MANVARISAPVLLFQGEQDRVVTPDQAVALYEALREQGTPVCYRSFPEEGHGFRSSETLAACLEIERWFYGRILHPGAAVTADGLEIDNWPGLGNS